MMGLRKFHSGIPAPQKGEQLQMKTPLHVQIEGADVIEVPGVQEPHC